MQTERQQGGVQYNSVSLSGTVLGDSEIRILDSGRELLNFELWVDGRKGKDPIVRVGFFPDGTRIRELRDGARVIVYGALRYRHDVRGLFVAAKSIHLVTAETATGSDLAQAPETSVKS